MTDRTSTTAIWTRLNADLRQFIRRRVADDHVTDDLLQETFIRVHRNLATLREADRLAAWVYQIARNVIRDHHRQAGCSVEKLATDPADEPDDHPNCLTTQSGAWMGELLQQLPAPYREAVQLAELAGLSQQQVADRLGLSISGAKSRIQRGRVMLKDILEQCCHFELDRRGNVIDYDPKPDRKICRNCGD